MCFCSVQDPQNADNITKLEGPESMPSSDVYKDVGLWRTYSKTMSLQKHKWIRVRSEMVPTDLTSVPSCWKNNVFCHQITLMNSCLSCRALTDGRNKGLCCMGNHKCHLNYLTVFHVATHPADVASLTSNTPRFCQPTLSSRQLVFVLLWRFCVAADGGCWYCHQRSVWCHEILWAHWAWWFSNNKIHAGKVRKICPCSRR